MTRDSNSGPKASSPNGRRSSRDAELGQPPGDITSVRFRIHLFVDVQNLAVPADVESPSIGVARGAAHDAIRGGDAFFRIAQQRVVKPVLRSEFAVGFGCVDTCREKRDIELAKGVAALTERPTVGRSAVGESFGEPGQHHDLLVAVVRQPVRSAVRSWQREVRRHLTRRRRPGDRCRRRALFRIRCGRRHQTHRNGDHCSSHEISRSQHSGPDGGRWAL